MRKVLQAAVLTVGAALVLVTVLSMVESNEWWIRMWDFPRLLIFTLAIIFGVFAVILLTGRWRYASGVALAMVALWQGARILPYTMMVAPEVSMIQMTGAQAVGDCFTALSLNVLQTNRDHEKTLALVRRTDPDILLLMETDKDWMAAIQPVADRYSSKLEIPLSNKYGMLFYTRLPVRKLQTSRLVKNDTPSIFAQLRTRSGLLFLFVALHPRPPAPGEDTDERDAEIVLAASRARRMHLPTVAMGDFNDVAWSDTSQMFKRLGHYLDPRVGRGFYATYPAALPVFRWPLDHTFVTEQFAVQSIRVLENVGSDHLPVMSHLCLAPRRADHINDEAASISSDDREDAREIIRESDSEIVDDNINSNQVDHYVPADM